jgi:hypothetical protein
MNDPDIILQKISVTTFEVIKKIISININLLRISKNKDTDPSKKNLDHLRSTIKEMDPEFIKKIVDLLNKDSLFKHIYTCYELTNVELDKKDNTNFSFEQIIDVGFYNE